MPCMQTITSVRVSDAQKEELKNRFGKAIEIFPGKTERWLMLTLQDDTPVCFAGDDSAPAAFVQVSILGQSDRAHFERMTAAICDTLESVLSIAPDRVYVKYEECAHWGWNGGNF